MILIGPQSRVASFDVDSQYCFTEVCPDELPVLGGTEIVEELNRQAKKAAFRLGSKDAHPPNAVWVADKQHPQFSPVEGAHVDVRWNRHAVPGTKGFELIKGLPHVSEYDFFVWKGVEPDMHPYGACYHDLAGRMETGVIPFLKMKRVTTVIVGGLATDYCVKNTALQLVQAHFRVIVNLGGCRGVAKDSTEKALGEMKKAGILFVNRTADLKLRAF
ncbi:MAG: isochorismatase family protein [Gammaproteobacteria bacterium]|nr:isochorismatase family protein [Gammaproteobacteria bacterium]